MTIHRHTSHILSSKTFFLGGVLVFSFFFYGGIVSAQQSPTEIQAQINSHNNEIANLEKEIATYQKQLNVISGQKQTLQSQINSLDISRKKIIAQTTVTQNKIAATNPTLNSLALKITDKSKAIELDKKSLAQSLRTIHRIEDTTLIERLLSTQSLSDSWISLDQIVSLNNTFQQHAKDLASDKVILTDQQEEVEKSKADLSKFNNQLLAQKGELDANKKAKEQLLGQTKAKESSYQSIIAQKRAQQKAFEAELSTLENSLKATNPATIPRVGSGILAWPYSASTLENCKSKASVLGNNFCITQFFGTTAFSTANPQVYNGSGHNAIDIGLPVGTAINAALSGTVVGTGNTDAIPGCYSYGKWILLRHANGLDTLYSHLSTISVSKGQTVSTGSLIGYSGMTGYATGPHLHFGVYASDATQILTLAQFRGATSPCANAPIPVAPKSAYLNPMSYL